MPTLINTSDRLIMRKKGLKETLLSQRDGIVFSCVNNETGSTVTFEIERPDPFLLKVYVLKKGNRRNLIGCIYPVDEYKFFFKSHSSTDDKVSFDVFKWFWYYCYYDKLRSKIKLIIIRRMRYV